MGDGSASTVSIDPNKLVLLRNSDTRASLTVAKMLHKAEADRLLIHSSTVLRVCPVISNCTGRPFFF